MSASSYVKTPIEAGAIAHVHFRVRCETLGPGEDVYLQEEGDVKRQKVGLRSIWSIRQVMLHLFRSFLTLLHFPTTNLLCTYPSCHAFEDYPSVHYRCDISVVSDDSSVSLKSFDVDQDSFRRSRSDSTFEQSMLSVSIRHSSGWEILSL